MAVQPQFQFKDTSEHDSDRAYMMASAVASCLVTTAALLNGDMDSAGLLGIASITLMSGELLHYYAKYTTRDNSLMRGVRSLVGADNLSVGWGLRR